MRLENLRKEMDAVDGEIVRLLNERAKLARKIGTVKAQAGLPIVDSEREEAILRRVCSSNGDYLESDALERIYKRIISESRRLQVENVGKLVEIYQ